MFAVWNLFHEFDIHVSPTDFAKSTFTLTKISNIFVLHVSLSRQTIALNQCLHKRNKMQVLVRSTTKNAGEVTFLREALKSYFLLSVCILQ